MTLDMEYLKNNHQKLTELLVLIHGIKYLKVERLAYDHRQVSF